MKKTAAKKKTKIIKPKKKNVSQLTNYLLSSSL